MKSLAKFQMCLVLIILGATVAFAWSAVTPMNNIVIAQGIENNTNTTMANANATNSMPDGSIGLTNFDIPSIDITLPDGSSTSADFRSIYFNSGETGNSIYTYYNDYGIPEVKPQVKSGDRFNIDAYPISADTPQPSSIQVSVSKILSGEESGNFTAMKLDKPISVINSGNEYFVPNTEPGNYIMDAFVKYDLGGIVLVYTMQIQIIA